MTRNRGEGAGQRGDGADGLLVAGLLLIGLAVVLAFGWAALAAYAGTVLVIVALAMAAYGGRVRGRKQG